MATAIPSAIVATRVAALRTDRRLDDMARGSGCRVVQPQLRVVRFDHPGHVGQRLNPCPRHDVRSHSVPPGHRGAQSGTPCRESASMRGGPCRPGCTNCSARRPCHGKGSALRVRPRVRLRGSAQWTPVLRRHQPVGAEARAVQCDQRQVTSAVHGNRVVCGKPAVSCQTFESQ